MPHLSLRIFLSSPSDAHEERALARLKLLEFPRRALVSGKLAIDVVAYDDPDAPVPLSAGETPQVTISRYKAKPSECDLTVIILGSRLGTPLPETERKPDGSTYASGTEWEFEDALRARKPIWIYHRTAPPEFPDDDSPAENRRQFRAVQDFLGRLRNPDGSFAGGCNEYAAPTGFIELFEKHLEAFVRARQDEGQVASYQADFSAQLRLAADFRGRDEIFAQLRQFTSTHPCGYFRVTAASGLGKTTLAAAVAIRLHAVAFFADEGRDLTKPERCLNHLSSALITRLHLPHPDLPQRAGEDSSFFEALLEEATERQAPLWLVVDSLDVAEEPAPGRNTLLLPAHLPAGVYCFVTQRPGDYPLMTDQDTPIVDVEINDSSPMQKSDIAAFLERQVAKPDIAAALHRLAPAVDPAGFVAQFSELSEGNFKYLSYLVADLSSGAMPFSLSRPEGLPRGLRGYYLAIWLHMEALAKKDAEGQSLYRRIIGLLAVSREPVTLEWLAEVGAADPAEVRERVLSTWYRFLSVERRGHVERWHLGHRSFGDFLGEKLHLIGSHEAVVRYFADRAHWARHEGYASRHLTTHMHLAGDSAGLFALTGNRAWYERQMTADPTGAAYENDLLQTGLLAATLDREDAEAARAISCLDREIYAALATATLKGFWMNIGPKVLVTLLKTGALSAAQTLDLAARNPDPGGLNTCLAEIAELLPDSLVPQAARIAVDTGHIEAVLALAPRLPESRRGPLLEQVLASERLKEDDDDSAVDGIHGIALRLADPDRSSVLREALDRARKLSDPSEQASKLTSLLDDFPDSADLLEEASRAAYSIDDRANKVEAMAGLLPHLSADRQNQMTADALTVATGITDPVEKSSTLIVLLPVAAPMGAVLDAALEAARALEDPEQISDSLLEIAGQVGDTGRDAIIQEIEQAVRRIPEDSQRGIGLAKLAAWLPERSKELVAEAVPVVTGSIPPTDAIGLLTSAGLESPGVKALALELA